MESTVVEGTLKDPKEEKVPSDQEEEETSTTTGVPD